MSSFSQIDTTKTSLPNSILREAAKDLIRYDGCKEELKLTQDKLNKTEEREKQKDSQILFLEEKDKNNENEKILKDAQISDLNKMSQDLVKEVKRTRTSKLLYKIGTYIGIVTTSFLLLK